MPNYVQYSTSNLTGSLRKGNVALGVTTASIAGPTSTTNWYTGITPAAGKYVIYKTAASGDPDIFCPQTDTELYNFVIMQGGTSANTTSVSASLAWIATQTGLMAVNFDYENIVTNGLTINVDAGLVGSYPQTGSTWYDLSGNSYNGALISNPTFSSANSGSIVFDGSNYIDINSGASILSNVSYTKIAWFYLTNLSLSNNIISGGNTGQHAFWTAGGNKLNAGHNGNWSTVVSTTTLVTNTWYCGAVTFDTTNGWKLYVNGTQESTSASTTTFTGTGDIQIARYQTGNNLAGRIAITQIYNRVLSAAEISQNYNAQKGRFGL